MAVCWITIALQTLNLAVMKILKRSSKKEVTMQNASNLGATGAAAGIAISEATGTDKKTAAILGSGITLLITGLILAFNQE